MASKRNYKLKDDKFVDILQQYDILLLVETWTNELCDLCLDGYEYVALHRPRSRHARRNSGGIVIYYRTKLADSISLHKKSDDNVIWLRLDKTLFPGIDTEKDLYLCACYVTPTASNVQTSDVFAKLTADLIELDEVLGDDNYVAVIAGDFNARTADRADFVEYDNNLHVPVPQQYTIDGSTICRVTQDLKQPNSNGHSLLELCMASDLRIVNGRVGNDANTGQFTCTTANGSSVVDYFLCKAQDLDLVQNLKVEQPTPYSDHNLLHITLPFQQLHNENVNNETVGKGMHKLVWKTEKQDLYIQQLTLEETENKFVEIFSQTCDSPENVEQMVQSFTDVLVKIADPLFGKTINIDSKGHKTSNSKTLWMSEECLQLRETFFAKLNIYRASKTDENRINMVQARSLYTNMARRCRRDYDKLNLERLVEKQDKDAKEFWKLLSKKSKSETPKLHIQEFGEYFKAISNPDDVVFTADDDIYEYLLTNSNEDDSLYEELNYPIKEEECKRAIAELKSGKAAGHDLLINELYVCACELLAPKLTCLFNNVFQSGFFPKIWSDGIIVPIHKNGSKSHVGNYRGITLLSTLGKLFTRVLNNRLTFWSDTYGIISDTQAGFRSGRGTTDNVFILQSMINTLLNKGKRLYCAFLDFRKAFDYISRDCLWFKLIRAGIRGHMYTILHNMYSCVKSYVRVGADTSETFGCFLGVRQGESLSPFLFSLFLNDMEQELKDKNMTAVTIGELNLFLLLYADDSVIFAETGEELQKGLDIVYDYCTRWRLTVNTDKTKVLVFRRGGKLSRDDHWFYGDTLLENVNNFCYLGLVFSYTGKWAQAQATLSSQALKAEFKLRKFLYHLHDPEPSFVCGLFDKLVLPILMYCGEVWGFHNADAVERIHTGFCKRALCLNRSTSNNIVYGELARLPLKIQRYYKIVKFWLKIVMQKPNPLVYKTYTILYEDTENGVNENNWAGLVRGLLCRLGFPEVWLAQGVANVKMFLVMCKQRLKDQFIQLWQSELPIKSTTKLYSYIKQTFTYSEHLSTLNVAKYRCSFVRFLAGNHSLPIVAGRWLRKPAAERLCQICQTLGDEFHFVFICTDKNLPELRRRYIDKYYTRRPSMFKFIELLSTTNSRIIKNLAVYIHKGLFANR